MVLPSSLHPPSLTHALCGQRLGKEQASLPPSPKSFNGHQYILLLCRSTSLLPTTSTNGGICSGAYQKSLLLSDPDTSFCAFLSCSYPASRFDVRLSTPTLVTPGRHEKVFDMEMEEMQQLSKRSRVSYDVPKQQQLQLRDRQGNNDGDGNNDPWGKGIGAWALEAEQAEEEERAAVEASAKAPHVEYSSAFLSLNEAAVATKSKKKKGTTLLLSEFTTGDSVGHGARHHQHRSVSSFKSKGITTEELLRLPTGPKDQIAEELEQGRLSGGVRNGEEGQPSN